MEPPKKSYSSKQRHVQILDVGANDLNDTLDNIDDKCFSLTKEGLLFTIWKMATEKTNVRMVLTIGPTRCLVENDYVEMLETLERHPDIKKGSVKNDDKCVIKATSINGVNTIEVLVSGANAFFKKIVKDHFEPVEDLTQRMEQCEAFHPPKTTGNE